jgi:predicted DsbA family dithiol-disulfide isomerase
MARMRDYRITGTPSMVVNGKYLVSGKGLSGQEEILKVVNYLITLETQALRAKQAADKALSAMPAKTEAAK